MNAFAYSNSPWPIREDLSEAFRFTWSKLAAPGNWLTGDQRIQIAREVRKARSCALCRTRKAALSPFASSSHQEDKHNADQGSSESSTLSPILVDVVHRLSTDASRLTPKWIADNAEQGVSIETYVEALSVVVSTTVFFELIGPAFTRLALRRADGA